MTRQSRLGSQTWRSVTAVTHPLRNTRKIKTAVWSSMAILSLSAAISSIPPTTRGFIVLTVVFTLLYNWLRWQFALDYNPYLTLVPGSCLFHPWTLLTAGFVETSIIGVGLFRELPVHATSHSPFSSSYRSHLYQLHFDIWSDYGEA